MDLFEKIFQIAWKKKPAQDVQDADESFSEIQKYLAFFPQFILGLENFSITKSHRFVGFDEHTFYLPHIDACHLSEQEIRQIYVHLLLLMSAASHLKIKSQRKGHVILDRLCFLERVGEINTFLDQLLPGFSEFQLQVVLNIENKFGDGTPLCNEWKKAILRRGLCFKTLDSEEKSNAKIPRYLFYSTPSVFLMSFESQNKFEFPNDPSTRISQNATFEKKIQDLPEEINLDEKECNPLMHSFEKIESTDEYTGDRKITSDENDPSLHQDSLSEVQFGKFLRDNKATSALFLANDFSLTSHASETSNIIASTQVSYSEWHYKENRYLKNYCQVISENLKSQNPDLQEISKIRERNSIKIKNWKLKIESLHNLPVWKNRLFRGNEIDLDEVVRDRPEMTIGLQPKERWYMLKKKARTELAVCIVFDQSMSTDSWVANKRIIDLILESIAIAGLLFDGVFFEVQVAGTYSQTRHQCKYKIYKDFRDGWSKFYEQLSEIQPEGYTRIGPALRHATSELLRSSSRKKMLILMTDGKPTDLDGYEGNYGISDIKKACLEAEKNGLFVFALIHEQKRKAHFTKMFTQFELLNSIDRLYEVLWDILMEQSQM